MVKSGAESVSFPRQLARDVTTKGMPIGSLDDNDNPTEEWLRLRAAALGLDLLGVCRRALDDGPIAMFVADARGIESRFGRPYVFKRIEERIRGSESMDDNAITALVGRLDARRYEDPQRAGRETRKALRDASGPVTIARLLGALASAHRMTYRLDWAMIELGLAIRLADIAGRREVVAELAQRAACVMMDRGELGDAEAILQEAAGIYTKRGMDEGLAHCLVDLAIVTNKQGRHELTLRRCRAALALDPASPRNRWSAHHNAAFAYGRLDRLEKAEREAKQAAAARPPGRFNQGLTAWLRGGLARERGHLREAARFYERAYQSITEPAADRLLISAERVRVLIELGEAQAAAEQARELLAINRPLAEDSLDEGRVLRMAAIDLALAGQRAELSAALVEKSLKAIKAGRSARIARLRERLRP